MNKLTHRGAHLALLFGLAAVTPSCAALGGSADDKNPTLITRDGPRAAVTVLDGAFSYSGGGSTGATVTVDGPDGVRTVNYSVSTTGWGWDRDKAHELEAYFRNTLNDTGAFYVVDRAAAEEIREDQRLQAEDIQEASTGDQRMLRADLMLKCTLTKLDDNAGGTRSSVRGGGFVDSLTGFITGGGSGGTRRGDCEILVEIIDRGRGVTVASAKGAGFSTGTTDSVHAGGWRSAIFGAGSSSSYEGVDMSAAIQRATIRAVNGLVAKIPAGYFKHELTFGE